MLRTLRLGLLVAPLALVACAGPSYINVPAQEGDFAGNDANSNTVRQVMAAGVKGLLMQKEVAAPVVVQLPEGATPLTHADVARRIGPDAVAPSDTGVEPAATVTVREVRVRGNQAEVDVVAPGPGGIDQLTTVHLAWTAMSGWTPTRTRTWRAGAHTVMAPAPLESP